MIKTVSDFLQALKKKEEDIISTFPIPLSHTTTIGDMYENATKKILGSAIFDGLNLTVRNGFIINSKKEKSKQIDCMIAVGNGTKIPNTDAYVFDISDVIAIVEVKKNFYGSDLKNAMDWSRDFCDRIYEPPVSTRINLLRDAWRSITGLEMPEYQNASSLPYHLEMIWHTLMVESVTPLRIFIGYGGYVDEISFRKGLIDYFEDLLKKEKGNICGPRSLPDIMICRDSTIYKLNGMPYPGHIRENGHWFYLGSRGNNPLHLLLEFIWTRLSYRFDLSSDIFGEDLENEGFNALLSMKAIQQGNKQGWLYEHFDLSKEKLKENTNKPWSPVEVSEIEVTILFALSRKDKIDINEPDFISFINSKGADVNDVVKSLCNKRLIYLQDGVIKYLIDACVVSFLPDGRTFAGDDKSGRMTRWTNKQNGNIREEFLKS